MFDIIIKGGTIIDGSGREGFQADLAIQGEKIVAIGQELGQAKRVIDATGKLVTPGWVDVHTHYDGQVTWDPYLTPSGWHGVTTVVMGNCGVGFAPVKQGDREWLIGLMEGVEDIPGAALSEGITWGWESFPEYLDALEKLPRAMDVGAQIPHGALRVYVMGERGAKHEAPTKDDLDAMARIVEEGIKAGAMGFSTSRTMLHKDIKGELVPGTYAAEEELFAIAEGIRRGGHGLFQMTSNHVDMAEEFQWMDEIARRSDIPVSFNCVQTDEKPELWKRLLEMSDAAFAEGRRVVPNVAGRPAGLLMGWQSVAHPFALHPSYQAIAKKPFAEMRDILKDPEFRAKLIAEVVPAAPPFETFVTKSFHKMFPLGATPDYEPSPESSVAALAQSSGRNPLEVAYDLMMEDDGEGLLYFPIFNYTGGTMEALREMLTHPRSRVSLGDGGAHCATICDASIPTFMLTHWSRDRSRGERIPLEQIVRTQTRDTAELYGLLDRGILAPGYKADVNVIDYDALSIDKPRMVYDLPAGGRRLLQRATGYEATLVSGRVVFENGEATGELPGALLRGPTSAPVAAAQA